MLMPVTHDVQQQEQAREIRVISICMMTLTPFASPDDLSKTSSPTLRITISRGLFACNRFQEHFDIPG